MELDLKPAGSGAQRPRSHWLELILIVGFLFSLLVGGGALASLFLLNDLTPPGTTPDAIHDFRPDQIPPQFALVELTGVASEPLMRQAMDAGQLETAYTIAAFDPLLGDGRRAGLYLILARRVRESGSPQRAGRIYELAHTIALLGQGLKSLQRGQILVQSAEGLLLTGQMEPGRVAAADARRVGEQASGLLPAQRSQIFQDLIPVYQMASRPAELRAVQQLLRAPDRAASGLILPDFWTDLHTAGEAPAADPLLTAAIATRQQAARLLKDRLDLTGGRDIEPERNGLTAALLVEDQVRLDLYRRQRAEGPSLSQQYRALQERRRWLALKVRVALGGIGLRLVPAWEADPRVLLQELANATGDLQTVIEARINAIPDPDIQAALRSQAMAWLTLQGVLGLYPGVSLTDLVSQLQTSQRELEGRGYLLALPIHYDDGTSQGQFRFGELN